MNMQWVQAGQTKVNARATEKQGYCDDCPSEKNTAEMKSKEKESSTSSVTRMQGTLQMWLRTKTYNKDKDEDKSDT